MDVIESSHFEVVKKWLHEHPSFELKVRSYTSNGIRYWHFKIQTMEFVHKAPTMYEVSTPSFGNSLKLISTQLSNAGGNNGSNG